MRGRVYAICAVSAFLGFALSMLPWASPLPSASVWHRAYFLDPSMYAPAYDGLTAEPFPSVAIAAIVPHHFVAARLMANLYERIGATQQPSVIVLIGPDHLDRSGGEVSVSLARWTTPFGDIAPAYRYVQQLLDAGLATIQEPLFDVEHSISVEAPFIAHAFPGVPFMPITIPSRLTVNDSEALGHWLSSTIPDDALVLISADFAHDVSADTARALDSKSIAALQTQDPERIGEITVDAPSAIRVLFAYLKDRGTAHPVVVAHENAATVTGSIMPTVTSYICMTFLRT